MFDQYWLGEQVSAPLLSCKIGVFVYLYKGEENNNTTTPLSYLIMIKKLIN